MSGTSSEPLAGVAAIGFAFTWPCTPMAGGRPDRPLGHIDGAFRFEAIMIVVAEASVVKVASEPVLMSVTPVVNSDINEEYTEVFHPSERTMLTLPVLLIRFVQ